MAINFHQYFSRVLKRPVLDVSEKGSPKAGLFRKDLGLITILNPKLCETEYCNIIVVATRVLVNCAFVFSLAGRRSSQTKAHFSRKCR